MLTVYLFACGPASEKGGPAPFVDSLATEWISMTDDFAILVLEDEPEQIHVKDLSTGVVRGMSQVRAASGVKYESVDSFFFWTKGDDFMWGQKGETLTSGKKRKDLFMPSSIDENLYGSYVSDGYHKRNEGYDWVGVRIEKRSFGRTNVSVRSRADRKRPTCTFDAEASFVNSRKLEVNDNGNSIILEFVRDSLYIKPGSGTDSDRLSFYCSGGATIAGAYVGIDRGLDYRQVDGTRYLKSLFWTGDTGFRIEHKDSTLTVSPFGLTVTNDSFVHTVHGKVIGAEVSDINGDGFAELGIYIQEGLPAHKGIALVYSVNNGKSLSMVNLPDLDENQLAGYNGFDEFAMLESTFVRRFPIFRTVGNSVNRSGYMRQIQYKLREGEAMRQLVVDQVVEY